MLVAARTVKQTQMKLNRVMRTVNNWILSHGTTLVFSKTEVIILTKKRIPVTIPIQVGNEVVQTKRRVKYLSMLSDSNMSFSEQITPTVDKAAKGAMPLTILMSVVLYVAEVWAISVKWKCQKRKVGTIPRQNALRVTQSIPRLPSWLFGHR